MLSIEGRGLCGKPFGSLQYVRFLRRIFAVTPQNMAEVLGSATGKAGAETDEESDRWA